MRVFNPFTGGGPPRYRSAPVLAYHYPDLRRRDLRRPDTRELKIRCLRIGVRVLKSRRDGLFIDQTAPRCFFLFFSGAESTPRHVGRHRTAPLKNKKKTWVRCLAIYKQAIPTGFGRIPKVKLIR